MGKDQQALIDHMTIKKNELEATIHRQQEMIRQLEGDTRHLKNELADAKLRLAGAAKAGLGGFEGVLAEAQIERERYQKEIRQKDAQLEAWSEMFRWHSPPYTTAAPLWEKLAEVGAINLETRLPISFISDTPPEETRKLLEAQNPDTAFLQMGKEAISVGVTISFYDGEYSGQLYNNTAIFPGTKEQAYEILVPYIISLLKLSALPEDLAPRGSINHYRGRLGKPFDDALLNTMYQISEVYWVDHAAEKLFTKAVHQAFDANILPLLSKRLFQNEIADARSDFNSTVKATFKNVANRRWPQLKKPRRLKPGPRPNN